MSADFPLKSRGQFLPLQHLREKWELHAQMGSEKQRYHLLTGEHWARANLELECTGNSDQPVFGKEKLAGLLINHQEATCWWIKRVHQVGIPTPEDLVELHRRMFRSIFAEAGAIRGDQDSVLSEQSSPPEATIIPGLLEMTFEWLSTASFQEIHEIEKSALLLIRLLDITPFFRGNGMVSRVFSSFYLLKSGFPPFIIPVSMAEQYHEAVQRAFRLETQKLINLLVATTEQGIASCLGDTRQGTPFPILEQ
jgi:fido (protein-threonine AMPylation protein)